MKTQVDKLYANYLSEQLAANVDRHWRTQRRDEHPAQDR